MNPPQWAKEAIASIGAQALNGQMTRAEADAAIITAAREHPEYGAGLGDAAMLSALGKYIRNNASSGDLFQAQMLEGLPASLLIAPRKSKAVADMTGEDLDHAKNMLHARTTNAIRGARSSAMAEREAFDRLYGKVRHLLSGGLKVSDVISRAVLEAADAGDADPGQPAAWLRAALARMELSDVLAEMKQRHPGFADALLADVLTGLHDGMTLAEAIKAAGTAA